MAQVDVGLPIPLGNYSYLPPVQTGINDAVEEQAMNPLLAWLAGQGIDLAAEKTGIKDVLRERGAGILDMIIPQAQAAESTDMPPVQTGFQPTTSVVAQDATGYEGFGPGGEFAMAPDVAVSTPMPLPAPQQDNMLNPQPIREDQSGLMRNPLTEWAMSDSTPPVSDKEVDEVIKKSAPGSMLGRLWDSTLGDEEWRLRKAMILNSMRLNPDAALTQAFASRIKDLRETRSGNRTADMLLERGLITEVQAELLGSGQLKASDIFGGTDKFSRILEMMKTPEGMKQLQQLKELGALGGGVNVQVGGQTMTPGREAVDKEYAKEYVQWTQSGGADMAGQLAQVQTVLDKLQSGEQLTGPTIGMAPDFYLYLTNPEAIDARQRVEEVVQRNLRTVLGAQFTEKEGDRLISRAYDPKLPPAQNAARLRRLFQQMQSAVQQRNEMAAYFEQNGTLAGYKGKRPSFDDFYKAIEGGTRESLKPGDVVNGWIFVGGDPANETSWKKQGAE